LFIEALATVLILVIGGFQVIEGHISIGFLVAFQSLMMSFLAPVATLVNLGAVLQELHGDVLRLDDVLENPPVTRTANSAAPLPDQVQLAGRLELVDVTFGYSPLEPPLVECLSLKVEPGRRVALVGGSGSGKSTVSKLICGLVEPWAGDILFDGQRRDQLPEGVLSTSMAMVEQDIFLFEGTVRENLTIWDRTVNDQALLDACRDAEILDTISAIPGGFGGVLAEGGRNLSGGQRQRLEIARALVSTPSLLVLDEATSALDADTEARIDENLRRRGCTCVIVAHRLSTIRDCDEIIVLDKGKVVERGSHEDLWKSGGYYSRLLEETDNVKGEGGAE
jgi:ATP-binding cassette subfamily C protein